jgi:hypothetical protein
VSAKAARDLNRINSQSDTALVSCLCSSSYKYSIYMAVPTQQVRRLSVDASLACCLLKREVFSEKRPDDTQDDRMQS